MKVYPCLELVGNEKYVVGSIDENGNFIPTPFYYDAKSRDALEVEECKTCNFLPICMGGCAVESIRKHGHPNDLDV
ncbi:SPASM domain-containing protein [Pyrococcus sp. NA2]|uniref:SPASM domain-containing protein n=1 Tax=Pyrococcus sp. (strain NA2) TaxID=342949 RepID=UPI001ED8C600|nr:SPASM domain-containing protein [Pyrococcus sp. NA2]